MKLSLAINFEPATLGQLESRTGIDLKPYVAATRGVVLENPDHDGEQKEAISSDEPAILRGLTEETVHQILQFAYLFSQRLEAARKTSEAQRRLKHTFAAHTALISAEGKLPPLVEKHPMPSSPEGDTGKSGPEPGAE